MVTVNRIIIFIEHQELSAKLTRHMHNAYSYFFMVWWIIKMIWKKY